MTKYRHRAPPGAQDGNAADAVEPIAQTIEPAAWSRGKGVPPLPGEPESTSAPSAAVQPGPAASAAASRPPGRSTTAPASTIVSSSPVARLHESDTPSVLEVHADAPMDPTPTRTPAQMLEPLEAPAAQPVHVMPPEGTADTSSPAPRAPQPMTALESSLLAVILGLGLALRLRDALSSPVIGAEDPYSHMERTWALIHGHGLSGYPPGLTILMAPFALLGPAAFYQVARFLPAAFGAVMIGGVFALARRWMGTAGALTAALLVATMPETIRRTDLLFPTALDLAILPWFLLLFLRSLDGNRRAVGGVAALTLVLLLSHPWAMALVAFPMAVLGIAVGWRTRHRVVASVTAGLVAVAGLLVALWWLGPLPDAWGLHIRPHLAQAFGHPASLWPLPMYVDLPSMLGWPTLVLAAVGIGMALAKRSRDGMLAILLVAWMLPFILVDWLDIWYLPHRTVAYAAIPIAMLAALPVGRIVDFIHSTGRLRKAGVATLTALAAVAILTVPAGATTGTWYRLYTSDDIDGWNGLAAQSTPYVVAGSWQARMGYRAVTGADGEYNPGFFTDNVTRSYVMTQHPGLVVLVDGYAASDGVPTGFLSSWKIVGHWGNSTAYAAP